MIQHMVYLGKWSTLEDNVYSTLTEWTVPLVY